VRSSSNTIGAGRRVALAALLALLAVWPSAAQQAVSTPDEETIERAVQEVKADPNLATERTIKTLRWKGSGETKPSARPAWIDWVAGFFRWLDQSARVLVWLAVGGLVGLLAFYIVRTFRAWDSAPGEAEFVAPTHVQDLDIRPESLPADIGGTARRVWDRGEHRAALALLYRGLLSRLAHVHHLPLRDSSTEGDCLALSARLEAVGRDYAARLIVLWQAAVYGHRDADTAAVYALCDGFATSLDPPMAGES
jgi:hypothetical protein